MNNIKKVLIISQDYDLFLNSYGLKVPGDPFIRHCKYQDILRSKTHPKSEIKIIVFTDQKINNKVKKCPQNTEIEIIGTKSIHRLTFCFDTILKIIKLIKNGWIPDLITTQNPWGEAIPALFFSKLLGFSYLPQIHIDISSKYWRQERPIINEIRKYIAKFVMDQSKLIRVVSEISKKNISLKYKIDLKKFQVAPVGISLQSEKKLILKKIEKKSKDKFFTILFIGRFEKQKNLTLWLETAFLILKKNQKY